MAGIEILGVFRDLAQVLDDLYYDLVCLRHTLSKWFRNAATVLMSRKGPNSRFLVRIKTCQGPAGFPRS